MRARGTRIEVDEPTAWQQRNARWLHDHPGVCALVGAVLLGAAGAGLLGFDPRWLGGLVGAATGAAFGWGFSMDMSREKPTGLARVLQVGALVAGIAFALALKVL